MKCPVCKTECNDNARCPECEFDQLSPEFLNQSDADKWMQEVVFPFRREYWRQLSPEFEIEDTVLLRYRGKKTTVKVPYGITAIGDFAFCTCECIDIEYIEVPSTVRIFGQGAFWRRRKLKRVTLPARVDSWDKRTFADCVNLATVNLPEGIEELDGTFFRCRSLRSISIPSTVRRITGCALMTSTTTGLDISFRNPTPDFYIHDGCLIQKSTQTLIRYVGSKVNLLYTPSDVRHIGTYALSGIQHVCLSDGVESIHSNAFKSLTSIAIPSSVKTIENNMLGTSSHLDSMLIDPANENYCVMGNYLVDKRNCCIIQVLNHDIEIATIPDGVKEIGSRVFEGCMSLKRIVLSDSVEVIRRAAFECCDALMEVHLSNTLCEIEDAAFWGDDNLHDIVIPASVCKLGERIFTSKNRPIHIFCEQGSWELGPNIWVDYGKGHVYPNGTWHYEDGQPVPNGT